MEEHNHVYLPSGPLSGTTSKSPFLLLTSHPFSVPLCPTAQIISLLLFSFDTREMHLSSPKQERTLLILFIPLTGVAFSSLFQAHNLGRFIFYFIFWGERFLL